MNLEDYPKMSFITKSDALDYSLLHLGENTSVDSKIILHHHLQTSLQLGQRLTVIPIWE